MKYNIVFPLFLAAVFAISPTGLASDKAPVLVTPSWLAGHVNDPNLVILNVSQSIRSYRREHIPGARFLWPTWVAVSNPELAYELVPVSQLDTLFEGLGVSNDSRVILYGITGNVSATARVYITLEYLGMGDRTSILDGGLEAWKAEKGAVTTEVPAARRGKFTPNLKRDAIVDVEYVKSHMGGAGVTVLDARAPEFYRGDNSGGFPRQGHIPGALNLFFNTLFDTANRYLPADSLEAKFSAAGVKKGDDIITYCHVGQTASSDYVAAKILGHRVHLYDGSFEDWSGRPELPIVVEAKKDSLNKH